MADSLLNTLNREYESWERDIDSARREITRIEEKKRRESELWERDISVLKRKIDAAEQQRKNIFKKIENRQGEIAREQEKSANKSESSSKSWF